MKRQRVGAPLVRSFHAWPALSFGTRSVVMPAPASWRAWRAAAGICADWAIRGMSDLRASS
ncbi:hypothetical protein AB0K16_46035 [Nonomuraea jabiensis]|uniref:hypothetical protein n=1 Tax=Nonomuraea jabiensis TaxID=882448 RepID=UPI0034464E6F